MFGEVGQSKKYGSLFEGGTVYQAFLSALSYHHWHAPIDGTV
jgi:phosphatidylserine decarboxylase